MTTAEGGRWPGLIGGHVHTFGTSLNEALRFGVAQSMSFESMAALPTTVYGSATFWTGRGDPVAIESTRVTTTATDDREGAE